MKDRRPYTYVVLRYRHDAVAGEFANVGVVLHEPGSGFLDAKFRHTLGRVSVLFPDLDGEAFKASLRTIESSLQRFGKAEGELFTRLSDAAGFARRILPDDDSSFIWSPVGSGVTADASATLNRLYDRFVARYDERSVTRRDDAAVWRPVRELLAQYEVADRLEPKRITSAVDSVEFEHCWKNGAWRCYQPLSFDLASAETIRDKAHRWAGQLTGLRHATEPFTPFFFVGLPGNDALLPAYRSAIDILKLSPGDPQVVEETALEEFVTQIEQEIRKHDTAEGYASSALAGFSHDG